jgi:hypothetical protein
MSPKNDTVGAMKKIQNQKNKNMTIDKLSALDRDSDSDWITVQRRTKKVHFGPIQHEEKTEERYKK